MAPAPANGEVIRWWGGVIRHSCARARGSVFRVDDVGIEVDDQAIALARAHDQRVVAHEVLQVMDLAVVGAVGRVVGDDLGVLPDALEVVFLHGAAVAFSPKCDGAADMVLRVRRGNGQHVAELGQLDLLLHRVGELSADLGAGEIPLNFHRAETLEDFLLGVDQVGLLIAEVEAVALAETGDAVFPVEGRKRDLLDTTYIEGELGDHHRHVNVVGPIEYTGAVREG